MTWAVLSKFDVSYIPFMHEVAKEMWPFFDIGNEVYAPSHYYQ
jgi:hypothetical protein